MAAWLRKLSTLWRPNRDFDDEIELHLSMLQERFTRQGVRPEEARYMARRQFGNATLLKQTRREMSPFAWLDPFRQDVSYALRGLRRSPGLAAVAVLSLALGIGANTAIFSLINAVMLRSLPVSHPEDLLQVTMGVAQPFFTNPVWEQVRDTQDVFSGILAYGRWDFNLAKAGDTHNVTGQYVSGQYFETLGVRAALGRTLTASDDRRGCAATAVLSHGFWQREYGGRADLIGKTISIDNHPFAIVGVT